MDEILQNFENYLTDEGKAISTIKHALIHVRGFLYQSNVTDLSQVNTQMITDYLTKLEGRSQARVNQAIWALRMFFRWANVPGLGFPRQKRPIKNKVVRPLSEGEVKAIDHKIFMYTREPMYSRRHLLMLMFYSGLRVKDMMTLGREDLHFTDQSGESESILEITKEGLTRKIRIPSDFSSDLQYYIQWYGGDINTLNVSVGNINYLCRYINGYDVLGDGPRIYPELFRVSWAYRCLEQGMSLQELQKLMGHKNIRSTKRYLKLLTQKEIKSLNKEMAG